MADNKESLSATVGSDIEPQLTNMMLVVCQEDYDNGLTNRQQTIDRLVTLIGSAASALLLEFPVEI